MVLKRDLHFGAIHNYFDVFWPASKPYKNNGFRTFIIGDLLTSFYPLGGCNFKFGFLLNFQKRIESELQRLREKLNDRRAKVAAASSPPTTRRDLASPVPTITNIFHCKFAHWIFCKLSIGIFPCFREKRFLDFDSFEMFLLFFIMAILFFLLARWSARIVFPTKNIQRTTNILCLVFGFTHMCENWKKKRERR